MNMIVMAVELFIGSIIVVMIYMHAKNLQDSSGQKIKNLCKLYIVVLGVSSLACAFLPFNEKAPKSVENFPLPQISVAARSDDIMLHNTNILGLVESLREAYGVSERQISIPMKLDGLSQNAEMHFSKTKFQTFEAALEYFLRPYKLTYCIKEDIIEIRSSDKSR